jgi:hypothetical protein
MGFTGTAMPPQRATVEGHGELRAVLQVQQHALALGDAALLLQERRQAQGVGVELGIADHAVVIDHAGLVRVALHGRVQAVDDGLLRQRKVQWQAWRPVRQVQRGGFGHGLFLRESLACMAAVRRWAALNGAFLHNANSS